MNEKSDGRRASTRIGDPNNPPKHPLCHLEGFWVGDKEEYECAIKRVFGFESYVDAHSIMMC